MPPLHRGFNTDNGGIRYHPSLKRFKQSKRAIVIVIRSVATIAFQPLLRYHRPVSLFKIEIMSSDEATATAPTCGIDPSVLNAGTVGKMDDLGLSVFAKLCGWNRGAFVLDPPDGHTYG